MRILFVDGVAPKRYDPNVLATEPLGGTEGSVIRIAEELARRGNVVRVTQAKREESVKFKAEYTPFNTNQDFKPTHVVVLRAPLMLHTARKQFPGAKLYLWCHDIFGGENWTQGFQAIIDTQAVPILVSNWHKSQMYDFARQIGFNGVMPSRHIYNPIDDDLKPDNTPVDRNKLIFFSSPHKGLEHTLKIFANFKNLPELKDMKLYVANPGYFKDADINSAMVHSLGASTHMQVMDHVRSSLAVLHLNGIYPETFGLVHAEADAVGTPCMTSRLAANNEVLDHHAEFVDVNDHKMIMDRLVEWKTISRPRVRANPQFRLTMVIRQWLEILSL